MPGAEAPSTVFEALITRWPNAPAAITYDNGCNLHAYMLNRAPTFFKETEVFVDHMHFKGHTACSIAYDTGPPAYVLQSRPSALSLAHPLLCQTTTLLCRCISQALCKLFTARAKELHHSQAGFIVLLHATNDLSVVHAILPVQLEQAATRGGSWTGVL